MTWIPLALALAWAAPSSAETPRAPEASWPAGIQTDLKFDDLFPRKSYFGKSATGMAWSHDDRYLAYLWNAYDDPGFDLWIYDVREGKSQRLTSPEFMLAYDRDIQKAIDRYKKDKEEEKRRETLTDLERRRLDLEDKKNNETRREPLPTYAGISDVEWSKTANEFLFVYRGDLFRWKLGEEKPIRLTKTRDSEAQPQYLKDNSGLFFRRGDGVYRMKFDSAMIVQLNPALPQNMTLGAYSISPDETKLMMTSFRDLPGDRQIDYITYRDRFAQARKTDRSVADDKFTTESYLFLYDLGQDEAKPKNDGKPWEIWKWAGGEEWWESSVSSEPWSPDSKRFVFGTWKRTQKALEIVVADTETGKLTTVYKATSDGEHTTPGMADPFFTADGKQIVALLDLSGFRHAWLIDPAKEGATQLTKGDFEVYPLAAAKDGSGLIVRAGKEHPARMDLYRVDLKTGAFSRITRRDGVYGNPVLSKNQQRAAVSFSSWSFRPEMLVMGTEGQGEERVVTNSHRDGWDKIMKLQPQLFDYKNRQGQTVYGFMMLPPGWKKTDKRPLMIYVYGGPLGTGKTVIDGNIGSTEFRWAMYLSYALGYVTVAIDPRGQSGYGAVFGKANWEQPGKAQTEDLQDGVRYLVENYGVDPKKVALNGWSFGGFQTQHAMYNAPETFTLGIAGAGPTEWQNYNTWYSGGVIGKSTLGKPDDLDKYSLTKVAMNLRNPLLLLHGMEDTNVLFQDTIKVYRVLLQYGKGHLVELSIDPTGGHGMGGDMSNRDRHAIYLEFLLKHWGPYRAE
ncbi:MAG TPA: prolyl oligopeptidase family serine peptidase [Fimbriimonadaceae bacterium]|nr:prolyl oligopeptidase family serine peptidase [Fimbriimonadaceae bacterium]